MNRKTMAWDGVPDVGSPALEYVHESGWRAFLGSWKWAAILVVACVVGLIGIFSAHPFASASVSERVSDELRQPSSCTEVGATQVAGVQSTIYRCTVGIETPGLARCFAVSGGDIQRLVGNRELGC